MIWIEMDIMALALGQAIPTDAAATGAAAPEEGFAQALESIQQSGAPPGPPLPPTAVAVGEEVANIGPNAQTQNPDFLPQTDAATVAGSAPFVTTDQDLLFADQKSTPTKGTPDQTASTPKTDVKESKPLSADEAVLLISSNLGGSVFQIAPPAAGGVTTAQNQTTSGPATEKVVGEVNLPAEGMPPISGKPLPPYNGNDRRLFEKHNAQNMIGSEHCIVPETSNVGSEAHIKKGSDVQFTVKDAATEGYAMAQKSKVKLDLTDATKVEIFTAGNTSDAAVDPGNAAKTPASSEQVSVDAKTAKTAAVAQVAADVADEDQAVANNAVDAAAKLTKQSKQSKPQLKISDNALDAEQIGADDNGLSADDSDASTISIKDARQSILAESKSQSNTASVSETAKTEAPSPLNRHETHLVVKQIADRMELLAATRPKQGVTIQLQPDHLGEVVMTVKVLGSSVDAQISASDERVRTALQQNGSMLVQAMDQRGIKVENVSISAQLHQSTTSHRDAAQQQQQQAQHQQAQQAHSRHTASYGARTTHNSVADVRRMTASASGVDYWI